MSKWQLPPEGGMDKANGIYYQNMTQKEIAERRKKNDVIIIPIGATETHGPGEPLGEDAFLVLGEYGRGRAAAFASSPGPHWGGMKEYLSWKGHDKFWCNLVEWATGKR